MRFLIVPQVEQLLTSFLFTCKLRSRTLGGLLLTQIEPLEFPLSEHKILSQGDGGLGARGGGKTYSIFFMNGGT